MRRGNERNHTPRKGFGRWSLLLQPAAAELPVAVVRVALRGRSTPCCSSQSCSAAARNTNRLSCYAYPKSSVLQHNVGMRCVRLVLTDRSQRSAENREQRAAKSRKRQGRTESRAELQNCRAAELRQQQRQLRNSKPRDSRSAAPAPAPAPDVVASGWRR